MQNEKYHKLAMLSIVLLRASKAAIAIAHSYRDLGASLIFESTTVKQTWAAERDGVILAKVYNKSV